MTEKIAALPMKSVCVGRFLIDVPADSIVTYGGAGITGWKFSAIAEEDVETFGTRLKNFEIERQAAKNRRGGQSLESVHDLSRQGLSGNIYVFDRIWIKKGNTDPQEYTEAVSIDALVHLNGVSYQFSGKYHQAEDAQVLQKILWKMEFRAPDQIPSHAGFCFERAMFSGELDISHHEFAVVFVGMADHPDLAIALSSAAGPKPTKTLLQRDAENSTKIEYRSRFHTFREGPRALNGIPGEEILDHVSEFNGTGAHDFMWESLPSTTDVYFPSLTLEMETGHGRPGNPIESSLSNEEALALWDKISSSLRRRPVGAAGASTVSDGPKPPAGQTPVTKPGPADR